MVKPSKKKSSVMKQAKVTVRRTILAGVDQEKVSEKFSSDNIEVGPFVTDTAKVSVSSSVKVNLGNYENADVFVGVSLPCYVEETDAAFEQASLFVADKLQEELDSIGATSATDAEEEEGEEEDEGVDIEELVKSVKKMKASDLEEVIDEHELDVDLDDHKKLADKRAAVIEALEEEEEEEEEGEDDEGEEEEKEGEEEVDAEELAESVDDMKKAEIIKLIEEHELDVDPDDHKKLSALRVAVVEAIEEQYGEEEEEEDADEGEEEEEEGEEEEPYTKDELKAMTPKELKEITDSWELKVKVKKGAKKTVIQKAYVKAVLDAQDATEED